MGHDHPSKEKETTRFIHKWMNHLRVARDQLGEIQSDPAKYDLVRALDAITHVATLLHEVQKDAIAEILLRHRRPELVG